MSGNNDLSMVTLDELIEEMKRRVTAVLLVYTQLPKVANDPRGDYSVIDFHGGQIRALGLAEYARTTIAHDMRDVRIYDEEGDDE